MTSELITVIVPVFNSAQFLHKALSSLEQQTYSNLEIIMINDGSTDDSEHICRSFSARDVRFKYFYQANGGVSKARNTGLKNATGQYVTFVDSDDWVDPDYVECLNTLLNAHDADISIVLSHEKVSDICKFDTLSLTSEDAIIKLYDGKSFDEAVWGKLYKKSLFANICFPENVAIGEDKFVAAEAFCCAKKIIFQPFKKYHYNFNPASATKATWTPRFWSCEESAELLYKLIADRYPKDILYGCKASSYMNLVIAQKLSDCGRLDQENYRRVKENILKYYNPSMRAIAGTRLILELKIFLFSRHLYIIARKIGKSKAFSSLKKFFTYLRGTQCESD